MTVFHNNFGISATALINTAIIIIPVPLPISLYVSYLYQALKIYSRYETIKTLKGNLECW